MRQITSITLAILMAVLVASCQKEDLTGDLVVNARDGGGASITGETVYIYANEADFNNLIYFDTRVTDNRGQVRFIDLDP